MNIKLKTGLVIIITLFIGILLGIQMDRILLKYRFQKHFVGNKPPRSLEDVIERIVRPDENQREAIKKVLDKHNRKMAVIDSLIFNKMTVGMDSLKKDLMPILTEEQKRRLEERLERVHERRGGRPPFPPPGEPGKPPFPDRRDRFRE